MVSDAPAVGFEAVRAAAALSVVVAVPAVVAAATAVVLALAHELGMPLVADAAADDAALQSFQGKRLALHPLSWLDHQQTLGQILGQTKEEDPPGRHDDVGKAVTQATGDGAHDDGEI